MPSDEFLVTPWEVEGNVDYNKLTALFGTQPIDDAILARFKRLTGSIPPMLRRQVFFSHRDFNWILDRYKAGGKVRSVHRARAVRAHASWASDAVDLHEIPARRV